MTDLGNGQSPIDISDWLASNDAAPEFAYGSNASRVERVQGLPMIHFHSGSEVRLGADRYRLLQLHWHTPAEHTTEAEEFDAELHFVHINEQDDLLVVGVVYRLGKTDENLQQIIDQTPPAGAEDGKVPSLSAGGLAPRSDGFYHYTGSLTAAPFSEPVQWYLARTVRTVSQRQVEQLQSLTGGPNARALQDRNERRIICVGCSE
ncbi:MAG: carbonic anhydrase family protein [Chloroflexota bacterium]|nr:carbonic anhydrase family protein [Chloroflexota bacterium]MDE2894963.1 carbonic anhydrase family protein [Chloroflexota bacterium]